jgi:cathepsin F
MAPGWLRLALALLACGVSVGSGSAAAEFGAWASRYTRAYASDAEREAAAAAFSANVARAATYADGDAASGVYNALRSPFADLTVSQFRAQRLLPPISLRAGQLAESCLQNGALDAVRLLRTLLVVPPAFDWRDAGAVTPVRDQRACGSCWAFATAQNVESLWALHGGELRSLSAQEVVDCSASCAPEGSFGDVCNSSCAGGWPWSAFADIIQLGGLSSEAQYPYVGVAGGCNAANSSAPLDVAATITGYTCLGSDEAVLRNWLLARGPFTVALDASRLALYAGGVYAPADCSETELDHAVLVVGYGTEDGTDFWTVKNSWGDAWGEGGYFRLARGRNMCGVANAASTAVIVDGELGAPAFQRFAAGAAREA